MSIPWSTSTNVQWGSENQKRLYHVSRGSIIPSLEQDSGEGAGV